MTYRIHLEKENFKFSCSHFTILSAAHAERLHGHNYYVTVELELTALDESLGMAFDFNDVKPLIRETTESFDELVLLPERSPHLKVTHFTDEAGQETVRALFGKKRYEFPASDVRILEGTVNITSEELARAINERLLAKLRTKASVISRMKTLSVAVEETRGQSVWYSVKVDEVRA